MIGLEAVASFMLGWLIGVFTPHVLEPLSRLIGSVWHLATRRKLDEHDGVTYAIDKSVKTAHVRKFLRVRQPD